MSSMLNKWKPCKCGNTDLRGEAHKTYSNSWSIARIQIVLGIPVLGCLDLRKLLTEELQGIGIEVLSDANSRSLL